MWWSIPAAVLCKAERQSPGIERHGLKRERAAKIGLEVAVEVSTRRLVVFAVGKISRCAEK